MAQLRGILAPETRSLLAAGKDRRLAKGNGAETLKRTPKIYYDCLKCPAYCCSYERIDVTKRDIERLARHFEITPEVAEKKFTKVIEGHKALRHQKDQIFGSICQFMDKEKRRCTVYEARPAVCRSYPEEPHCGYYSFLTWEREHQDDPEFIPYELG